MLLVSDIIEDAREVFGVCDSPALYRHINDAISLLVTKGDWTPMLAYLDVAPSGDSVFLPSDVETPLAVLVNGHPTLSRNELYRFHLNGPGDYGNPVQKYSVEHQAASPVMADLPEASTLSATLERAEDAADTSLEVWVTGYDVDGNWVRTDTGGGVFVDGWPVPLAHPAPPAAAPTDPEFSRIVGVRKTKRSAGTIRLHTTGWVADTTGTLLGVYLPHEVTPWYRRLRLPFTPTTVRLYIRRKTFLVAEPTDFIPLHHRFALVMAMRAVKAYNYSDIVVGNAYEANAARMLNEQESVLTPPGPTPIQVSFEAGLVDQRDNCMD